MPDSDTGYYAAIDASAATLVGEHLHDWTLRVGAHHDWALRAGGGMGDVKWQPRAPAPRGATSAAEFIADNLMHGKVVSIDPSTTDAEGARAIARALAVIALDVHDDPPAQQMAVDLHDRFARLSHTPPFITSAPYGPESVLRIPGRSTAYEVAAGNAAFKHALAFVTEVLERKIADAGSGRDRYVLALQGMRLVARPLEAMAEGIMNAGAEWLRPPSRIAAMGMAYADMGADKNTPESTVISAAPMLISSGLLTVDVLLGQAERLGFGGECKGNLFAASVMVPHVLHAMAMAIWLVD